ncbi:hypothetical protein RhiLY_09716 [Ceratobasidium sp. AG-Ba]|nr:hypothetical protein RhiLY_09716 [Ceratobasidium sp. AG-Ba]
MSLVRTFARSDIQPNPSLSHPALSVNPEAKITSKPRRSHRERRPSTRRLESDEYEASQRESDPQSKPKNKSRKRKSSKPGNRPGIIIQPSADIGPTSHQGSQGSASGTGSNIEDTRMATPDTSNTAPKATNRAKAVLSASSILGIDASRYSSSTLKQIIASRETICQEGHLGPMEDEARNSPSLQQSTGRVGLASGRQSFTRNLADGAATSQERSKQPISPSEPPRLEVSKDNTDTEPSSDSEHLRPEDSVSQRIPPPPRAPSQRPLITSLQAPNRPSRPPPFKRTGFSSGSNLEPEEETVRSLKRQRTTPASLVPPLPARPILPPRPLLPSRPLLPARPQPSQSPSQRSLSRPTSLRVRPTNLPQASSHEATSSLFEPPPTSDPGAVLAWAVRVAKHASSSRHVTEAGHSATYQQLASVLDDLRRSHQDSSATHPVSRAQRSRTADNSTAVLEAEAALVLGKQAAHKRAGLQDFPGLTGHIAALSIPKLIATVVTKGAYGTHDIQAGLTAKVFNSQWTEELPDLRVQKPPAALISLLVHRISWARYQAKVRIRPHIPSNYGFINPPRDAKDLKYNRKLAKDLLPNAFHCRNLKTDVHPYEHPALAHCIAAAFFWAGDSVGMSFHKLFYPIPIPTVAMTLTNMQHGISEWTTGRYLSKSLDLEKQRKIYEAHLAGLANFGKDDPDRLHGMQIDWFWYAVDYAGGLLEDDEPVQPVTWANRVSADKSGPDINAEDDDLDADAEDGDLNVDAEDGYSDVDAEDGDLYDE